MMPRESKTQAVNALKVTTQQSALLVESGCGIVDFQTDTETEQEHAIHTYILCG